MRLAPAAFGGGSPNALLALLNAGKHLATAKAGNSVLQAGCVLCDFGHWSFHPEQCRVCFFFCFARPPLFPQGENRKMFLTAENFYKNILGRQKSHPVVKLSGCTMCSYCCVLMYSSNCPRRGTKRRSASERVARKPLRSSIYASSLLPGEKKKSVQTATASGSFFATCFKEVSSFSRISSAFNACVLSVSLQNNSQY